MAFSLKEAKIYRVNIPNAVNKFGYQVLDFTIGRSAAGDVSLDLWNTVGGTFWTQAVADATFGELAKRARDAFAGVVPNLRGLVSLSLQGSNGIQAWDSATAAALKAQFTNAGTYPVFRPVITVNNNVAPAELKIMLVLDLKENSAFAELA